jgi:hypothetical protein
VDPSKKRPLPGIGRGQQIFLIAPDQTAKRTGSQRISHPEDFFGRGSPDQP